MSTVYTTCSSQEPILELQMPVVTQSRTNALLRSPYQTSIRQEAGLPSLLLTSTIYTSPTQTTTSYRTGGVDDVLSMPSTLENLHTLGYGLSDLLRATNRQWDHGHEFFTERQWIDDPRGSTLLRGNPNGTSSQKKYWYEGPVCLDPRVPISFSTYPSAPSAYNSSVADGVHAVNVTIPTNPAANVSTGVAELIREGFPRLIGSDLMHAKASAFQKLGGEYLNVVFGWQPFINDVRATAHSVLHATEMLRQLEKDSGKGVRRRFVFDDEVSTLTETVANGGRVYTSTLPTEAQQCFSSVGGSLQSTITTERRKWFSGKYTYYLKHGSSNWAKIEEAEQRARLLLGLELTPEVLWELTPWSWLSDWFVNIGDNLANASRFGQDGLVMRYGYLMVESTVKWERTCQGISTYSGGTLPPLTLTTGVTRKQRFKASPFGFGTVPGSFNPRQWAILGALGMTKTPSSLLP
jgi:hypothetical protein